jgi:hypothetical protein
MSKMLSGIELEVIVSKLMAAKAEILHLIIEEENVSEAASDLWGVIEMLRKHSIGAAGALGILW